MHALSDLKTRVPLFPLFTYDEEDYTEDVLYDVEDVYGFYDSDSSDDNE